ncbi:hypothetical protein [Kribbella kalugense]|nr:hypothetical protein [Kribbella kalugense]
MSGPVHAAVLVASALIVAISAIAQAPTRDVQIAVLVTTGLVIIGLYLLACRIWPYAKCTRCSGSGKSRSLSGKKFRDCPRCKGTGRRRRIGRRLIDRHSNR